MIRRKEFIKLIILFWCHIHSIHFTHYLIYWKMHLRWKLKYNFMSWFSRPKYIVNAEFLNQVKPWYATANILSPMGFVKRCKTWDDCYNVRVWYTTGRISFSFESMKETTRDVDVKREWKHERNKVFKDLCTRLHL